MDVFFWGVLKTTLSLLLPAIFLRHAYRVTDEAQHPYWTMMFGYPIGFGLFLGFLYYLINGSLTRTLHDFYLIMSIAGVISFMVGGYKLKKHLDQNI